MYLKALEIQGFKSFADKTTLTFKNDITAIVGPNGSGKSNISDALLWVMGEQRTKTLRGSKMEDVIFGGTEKRSPVGFAEVSLILDNKDNLFDIDSDEVVITRRYYRSGESQYYINKEQVRLKDINSILMDTGLGRDGYSVIGQGRIAEIVSTKTNERREVFEEAAGISRFRYRKEDAERKLEKTEENLLRVNDKIDELELQVEPLKRQSEVAKKYLSIRDNLKVKEISLWMETLDNLRNNAEKINNDYDTAKKQLDEAHRALDAIYASADSISERMHQKDIEAEDIRNRLNGVETDISGYKSEKAVIDTNIENCLNSIERIQQDIINADQRTKDVKSQIEYNNDRLKYLLKTLSELNEQLTSSENIINGCRIKLNNKANELEDLRDKNTRLTVESRNMESRIQLISSMEKEFQGYNNAVRTVMKETQRGTLRGIHGPVASLVKTDDKYALAIETAMGSAMQNIVVTSQNDGRNAIEMLKRKDSGRATFLPLDVIKGKVLTDYPSNEPGFIGLAINLVHYDDKYREVFNNLLGRTIVAESLTDAINISKKNSNKFRIVTLDGQLLNAGGSMTGGSYVKGAGILSRANELERLKVQKIDIDKKTKECEKDLNNAKVSYDAANYKMQEASEELIATKNKITSNQSESKAIELSIKQLETLMLALTGDSEERLKAIDKENENITKLKSDGEKIDKKIEDLTQKINKFKDTISQINKAKLELESKRNSTDKTAQNSSKDLLNLERTVAKFEQKKLSAEMEEKQILDKLWDNYELSYSTAMNLRKPIESIQKENKIVSDLRRQLGALGTPNLGAIDEYARVKERYDFLSEQRNDINKSKKELIDIIDDVTTEMKSIFTQKFREIDNSFKETFRELFGGGKAELVLEDEENVLDCDIEIKVQPPGKALSSISLMSGGELAFVAIALYFAMMKVRPTPFCIMDEIEAALDESNVLRFANYMSKYSDKTQFIVITHRRGTMEQADYLYGVTMQEKGVSSVLALDMEEAKKTIEQAKR